MGVLCYVVLCCAMLCSETMAFMDCSSRPRTFTEDPWIFCGEGWFVRLNGGRPVVVMIDGTVQYHGTPIHDCPGDRVGSAILTKASLVAAIRGRLGDRGWWPQEQR